MTGFREYQNLNTAAPIQNATRPLLRPIVTVAIFLTLLHLAMFVIWRPAPIFVPLPWVIPMITVILVVIASSVSFLALVRYRVLRDSVSYWTGIGFAAFGVGYVFHVLTWPGLGNFREGPLAGHFPTVAAWVSLSVLSLFAVSLLAASLSRWPHATSLSGSRWVGLLSVCLFFVIVGGVTSILLENSLPELVQTNGAFTPLALAWSCCDAVLFAWGALLSARRYLRTGDTLPGFVAFTQLSITFVVITAVVEGNRFGITFLLDRFIAIGGFLFIQFGLLSEYVRLFECETERSHVLELAAIALKESQERLLLAQRAGHVGIFDWDMTTDKTMWSGVSEEQFGIPPDSFEGEHQGWAKRVHPEDLLRVESQLRECTRAHCEKFEVDYRILRENDGEIRLIQAVAQLIYAADGAPIRMIGTTVDITDRKSAEERLRASEERYRTLVDKAPDAILVYDLELGQILDANPSAERMFSCPRSELVGGTLQRFSTKVWPEGVSIKECIARGQNKLAAGEEVVIECSLGNFTGNNLICDVRLVELPAQGRRLIRASFLDVTGRRLAEQNQRMSEEKFRRIFENAPFGIFQASADGRLLSVNPTIAGMFGFDSPQEMLAAGSDVAAQLFVHPAQRESLEQQTPESAGYLTCEGEYRRRNGSSFEATLYARAVPAADGRADYFEGFIEDITFRKKAIADLRKLSQAVEQSPVSIVITDTMGNIEFVNPKLCQLTGYDPHEVLGQDARLLKSEQGPDGVYDELWSTISSGRIWEGELQNKKKNGELFWEHATISPIRDSEGTITNYIAIKEDITEQKSIKEQLLQSQKMEAIGQLAGGIAHDFNNILTVIIGYASILSLSPSLEMTLKQKVDQIISSAEKAAQLTRALLAFSRKQIMDPKPADLNAIVRQVQMFLTRIIGEDVRLKLVINEPEIRVRVDRGQIEQVLMNLAANARDAMPKGGQMVIETDIQEIPHPKDHSTSLHAPVSWAVISVSDTGTGMDKATLSRIFEPFFSTKEVGKGTGLGMAIVHGVINQHDGFINVYSEPGHGTTFRIYLPLSDRVGQAVEGSAVAEPVRGGSETILVAEDDAAIGELTREVLTGYGYQVLVARDGEEAVATFREHKDAIGLVIMDMIMPKKSGWEAIKEISGSKPGVRVLLISGYTKDFIRSRGELEEGTELLLKPVQPLELLRRVRRMLDRGSLGGPF